VFAVLLAVIGAFYYLRIVKLMYFDEAQDTTPISAPLDMQMVLSLNALALLLLGMLPQVLMNICGLAVFTSLQ
jgi:NADH-quinone oxidoreductase subunit N